MTADIPRELAEQFTRGNGVIFVGAGLSQGAGLPGWADLVRELAAELEGCPPDADHRDIAQYYDITYGRNRLVQKLRDRLDTLAVQPTPVHEALVKLPVSVIFTTNYDNLLEQALRAAKCPFTPVIGNVDASFWSADRLQLVKLHGDLNQPESIVITAEDYERFTAQRPALARSLALMSQTHTVLFLGYSATDPDLRLILTQVRDEGGRFARNLYIVQFGPPPLIIKDLERRGLRVVDLGSQCDVTVLNKILYAWLQELGQRIQRTVSPGEATISHRDVKADLPPLGGPLVGRDRELGQLMDWLREGKSPLIIEGMACMGKSALATAVAHACYEEHLFDAFFWWSAGYEPHALEELLDAIGRLLGHRTDSGQPTYSSPEGTYDLLRQHKCLLIVTKVTQHHHSEILDFLSRVPSTSSVLLTTISSIPFGRHIVVEPLDPPSSLELIRIRAEQLQCHNLMVMSDEQLRSLCEVCAGSPVALHLAVGLAKRGRPLDRIVEKLQSGDGEFDVLCADAYRSLPQETRSALHLICISQESIAGEALESILQTNRDALEISLAHLVDMALVTERSTDTWKSLRLAPANRLVREYCNNAIRTKQPEEDHRLHDMAAAYYYEECKLKGHENWSGHDWIEINRTEVLATLDWYDRTHQWSRLVEMMKAIYYFLGVRGYWRERLIYGDRVGQAARQLGDRQSEAEILVRVIGWTEVQLGEYTKAREDIERGLKIFEEVRDNGGLASAYRYLGTIERRRNNFDQAASFYRQAMDYAELTSDSARLIVGIRVSWGTLYLKTSRLPECEQQLQQSMHILEKLDHRSKLAEVMSRLADVRLTQGQIEEAERLYRDSEQYVQQTGRQKTHAYNLLGLARVAHSRGDYETAYNYARQAREMFGNLGIADESSEVASLLELTRQCAPA